MKKRINIVLVISLCLMLFACDTSNDNNLHNINKQNINENIDDLNIELFNNGNNTGEIVETDITLFEEIIDSDLTSLIYVGRPTCPACVAFYPTIEEVAKNYKIDFFYINIDTWNPDDLATLFLMLTEVKVTPTLLIKQDGITKNMITGNQNTEDLIDFLKNNLIIDE